MMDELIYVWPDGYTCSRECLEAAVEEFGANYEAMTQQEHFDTNAEGEDK